MDKKEKSNFAERMDNAALKYSSTKLGLTDYDKNKNYNTEERKITLKDFGIILAVMAGIIAVAAALVLFVLT